MLKKSEPKCVREEAGVGGSDSESITIGLSAVPAGVLCVPEPDKPLMTELQRCRVVDG